ncbi:hypothetical protein Anapl_08674 [Anas platyrhynchos]|uniref:Uncharacterized protein n=1 Tax=Anas platyrhynchos TaxID=8839 RepID=R0K022_ANAPL|nr:hypothetical protein Anapl_08674 [Anas platyrhynchos]
MGSASVTTCIRECESIRDSRTLPVNFCTCLFERRRLPCACAAGEATHESVFSMKVTHGNSSCSIRKQEQASRVCVCFSRERSEDDQNSRTQDNFINSFNLKIPELLYKGFHRSYVKDPDLVQNKLLACDVSGNEIYLVEEASPTAASHTHPSPEVAALSEAQDVAAYEPNSPETLAGSLRPMKVTAHHSEAWVDACFSAVVALHKVLAPFLSREPWGHLCRWLLGALWPGAGTGGCHTLILLQPFNGMAGEEECGLWLVAAIPLTFHSWLPDLPQRCSGDIYVALLMSTLCKVLTIKVFTSMLASPWLHCGHEKPKTPPPQAFPKSLTGD